MGHAVTTAVTELRVMTLPQKPAAATDMVLYVVALFPVAGMCLVLQVFVRTIATTAYVVAQDNRAAIMAAAIIHVVVTSVVEKDTIVVGMRNVALTMKCVVKISLQGNIIVIHLVLRRLLTR